MEVFMKIIKLLLCAYVLPMIAMQSQNQSFLISNTKRDVQRKNIMQLQRSIHNLQQAIDSVKGLEEFASEDPEEVTFLDRFEIKLAVNEQELIERYRRRSEFKSADKNLA